MTIKTKKEFNEAVKDIQGSVQYKKPLAYAVGIRRRKQNKTLDVHFPVINWGKNYKTSAIIRHVMKITNKENGFHRISSEQLDAICKHFIPFHKEMECHKNFSFLTSLNQISKTQKGYSRKDVVVYFLFDKDQPVDSPEDAYFKLQCLSQRHVKPHGICLDGIFGKLNNIAWTNFGPMLPDDVDTVGAHALFAERPLRVHHVDKFPYMMDYHVPDGVRVASGSQVRLGAYLGEGTTVMPAGFVNFNAGTDGNVMVEGRISAGVFVGKNSDIGGGASIMGTLSGGNKAVISIGEKCLLGANSGTGISLGFGCTIEAGLYVTAGMKVRLYNAKNEPVNLSGKIVKEGKNIVKASSLSGKDKLLFMKNSQTGELLCKPNPKTIKLNPTLHKN